MRYFVIRGFGIKKDSEGNPFNFDEVHLKLIEPALKKCGFEGGTTGQITDSGSIHEDMFALILEADVVVCDITVHNANVFYELGVRHALRKKRTVLIKGEPSADKTPFDIGGFRYLGYSACRPADAVPLLVDAIAQGQASERQTDNPVFHYLPGLVEAQPDQYGQPPRSFIEEVELAVASADCARLSQLAIEVPRLRYPWAGLAMVARAQFKLKSMTDARGSWEALRNINAHALEAELALGNIYERLSRNAAGQAKAELLERSNQALRTALNLPRLSTKARGEALAQQARNLKTLWRMEWQDHASVAVRRAHALHRRALDCFEGYIKAFEVDLNGCYHGLAALQMGTLLCDLMQEPGWEDLHSSAEAAAASAADIKRTCASLTHVVDASIRRTLKLAEGEELMWAEISRADLLFLTEPESVVGADSRRVTQAYRAAKPANYPFACEAAVGQLSLFRALGFRAGMAEAAINTLAPAAATPSV